MKLAAAELGENAEKPEKDRGREGDEICTCNRRKPWIGLFRLDTATATGDDNATGVLMIGEGEVGLSKSGEVQPDDTETERCWDEKEKGDPELNPR